MRTIVASFLLVAATAFPVAPGVHPTGKPTGAPAKASFVGSLMNGPNKAFQGFNNLAERAGLPIKVPTPTEVQTLSEESIENIVNRRFDELAAQWEARLEESFPVFNKFHHKKSTKAPVEMRRLEMFDLPDIFPWAEKSHPGTKAPGWTGAPKAQKAGLFSALDEQVDRFTEKLDVFEMFPHGVSKAPKTGAPSKFGLSAFADHVEGTLEDLSPLNLLNRGVSKAPKTGAPSKFGLGAFADHVGETFEELSPLNLLNRGVSKAPKTGAPKFGLSALGEHVEETFEGLNPLNLLGHHGTKGPKGTGAPKAKASLFAELGDFADSALHPFGGKTGSSKAGSSKAPRFQIPIVSSLADKVEAHLDMFQGEGTD